MKTLVVTSLIALGAAMPAVAQSQLEQSLGVEAGAYTLSELATLKLAASEDSANDRARFFDNQKINFSASDVHDTRANEIFDALRAESLEDE